MQADLRLFVRNAALALVGLALATWAWLGGSPTEIRAGVLPFSACAESELTALELKVGARSVAIHFRGDAATISLTRRVSRPVRADGAGSAAGLPSGMTPTETLAMGASTRVLRLRSRYAPALAKRSLGKLDAARRKKLGLATGAETLQIQCGSESRQFTVGTTSYGGAGRYIENQANGIVWLVDPTLISDVRLADSRFVERRLVASPATGLERAEVRALGQAKKLLHRNHHSLKQSEWVAASAPDQRNELYGNWLNKVLRLRAISWLNSAPADQHDPQSGRAVRHVRRVLTVQFTGAHAERVELWRGEVGGPKGSKAAPKRLFWARSAATGGWVSISRTLGQQLADDVAAVVGAPSGAPGD